MNETCQLMLSSILASVIEKIEKSNEKRCIYNLYEGFAFS